MMPSMVTSRLLSGVNGLRGLAWTARRSYLLLPLGFPDPLKESSTKKKHSLQNREQLGQYAEIQLKVTH